MADFVLALDQGTSSSRAILFDHGGNIVSASQQEYPISYPQPGWVEQSAEELLVIKTRADLFAALEKRVRELHSYSVPEVIALPIVSGSETYLRWLGEQVVGGAA